MARILDIFLDRKTNRNCAAYTNANALFDALKSEADPAIRCLYSKISGSVFNLGKTYRLPDDDVEDLICDCIALFLQKIREGSYVFQGYDPATFVIEIAKNKVKNFGRNLQKRQTADLEAVGEMADEQDFTNLAATETLARLLNQLGENCQKLIRLKYLEELRDKDVIDQKLTQYSTVDALKNHRAQCMKKLTGIAATGEFNFF